jgi:hypothetical protein
MGESQARQESSLKHTKSGADYFQASRRRGCSTPTLNNSFGMGGIQHIRDFNAQGSRVSLSSAWPVIMCFSVKPFMYSMAMTPDGSARRLVDRTAVWMVQRRGGGLRFAVKAGYSRGALATSLSDWP